MNHIQKSTVEKFLLYDKASGFFYWKPRPISTKYDRAFNSRWAGKKAGSIVTSRKSKTSYIGIKLLGKTYKAHRLALLIIDGSMPEEVDHIDGDGRNNSYSNLRRSNRKDNAKNPQIQKSNKTGVIGVNWHKAARKWQARAVNNNGQRVDLGRYDNFEKAAEVRKEYEKKFKYAEYRGDKL
jgi:hypothetical protein